MSFLNSLEGVRAAGSNKWEALCPVHGSTKNRTLKIKQEADGSYLCHCFSCGANGVEVFNAIKLPLDELFGYKDKPKQIITSKQQSDYELDKIVIQIHKADKIAGKHITVSDFRRNKLALARIANIERIIESNKVK